MPIGSISKSGSSFRGAAEYDLAQGIYAKDAEEKKPEIIEQNFVFGDNAKDLGKQFRDLAQDNDKCKKPVMKFSISFDPKEKMTDAQKKEFTKRVMNEMGIKEDSHQYMITRHSDKGHDHHHILANRVGMDGKLINDSFSKARLEKAIDKTEKEMKLNNDLAKSRRFVYDETQEKGYRVQKENFRSNKSIEQNQKPTKEKSLDNKKSFMIAEISKAKAISKSPEELKINLKEKNIDAEMRFDKSGKFTGVAFNYDNLSVKGSALGKEFKASQLQKEFSINASKVQENKEQITQDLKAETLKNIDTAIEKMEPYREHNSKTYEGMQGLKVAVSENQIENKSDLEKINKVAKTHISDIERMENMQKEKPQKIEPEKPQIEQKEDREYSRFEQNDNNRKEKEKEQEQKKGRGR